MSAASVRVGDLWCLGLFDNCYWFVLLWNSGLAFDLFFLDGDVLESYGFSMGFGGIVF